MGSDFQDVDVGKGGVIERAIALQIDEAVAGALR
jgi:hypothetical protein